MINVNRTTQTYSSAPQASSLKNDEDPNSQYAAGELKKVFGDQTVGDIANKIADPGYVDPAKKMRTVGNNELGKDAFMKLMLAQMKNQDPTNPMQSHEMAAQLAQFTSLEQLSNINTTLEAMKEQGGPKANFQMLALIGKKVSGDSAKVNRATGDTKHGYNFTLLGDAQKATVTIRDTKGQAVRTLNLQNLKKGQNSVVWDGLSEDGMPARAGEYRFAIEAQSSNGGKIAAKSAFEGRITGLNYTAEGPVLMVGEQAIKLSDVKRIEDAPASAGAGASASTASTPAAATAPAVSAPVTTSTSTRPGGELPAAPPAQENNLTDLAMPPEMKMKLMKEIG